MGKVILLRGLPGCGKSAYVKHEMTNIKAFSADQFFMKDGEYLFDPSKIGLAHAVCFKDFLTELPIAKPFNYDLVIDNTNIRAYEMAPYIQAANAYGLEHEIITIWAEPDGCYRRTIHGVPFDKILSMYQAMLTEQLPPFWKHRVIIWEHLRHYAEGSV
jgi:NEDD4-binding protein 2